MRSVYFGGIAVIVCALLFSVSPAWAIVGPPETPADFTGDWTGTNWSMATVPVYKGAGSFMMISPTTAIMAGHVAPMVNTAVYLGNDGPRIWTSVVFAPDADICIAKVSKPWNNWCIPSGLAIPDNAPAIMIGWGYGGTIYPTYYSPDSSNTRRLKRWGTNTVPLAEQQGSQYVIMKYSKLDAIATEFESGVAGYDSGGGTFVKVGNTWELAGIHDFLMTDVNGNVNGTQDASVKFDYQ